MTQFPTFNKWATSFMNFIKPNTKSCVINLSRFIKSNPRGLICGTIFVIVYVIVPMFYSSLDGNTWTGQYTDHWLLGFYPALILLGFICAKPTQSATAGENVTSGLISGLISTLPLLIPTLLILVWRSLWMIWQILNSNFVGKEPLALIIFGACLIPIPFAGGLGGMIRHLYFHFTHTSDSAVKSLMEIAEKGDMQAQMDLAKKHYDGQDTPQDYIKAAKWLTEAANQGNAEAQCGLGIIYFDGLGVEKDYQKAAEWWTKSANQGYIRAQKNLKIMHTEGLIPKWIMPEEEKKSISDAATVTKEAAVEQNVPGDESEAKKGLGILLPIFLLVFGILGWHTGMCFVFLFRSLFGASIISIRLVYFIIFVALTLFAFYKFQIIRHNRNSTQWLGINTLFMGLVIFLMGAVIWRIQWVSPAQKWVDTFENSRLACMKNVKDVISVSGVTESHTPGSGYILVKATLLATQPITIFGDDWVPKHRSSYNHPFSSTVERTKLEAGKPQEVSIRIINAADRDYVPKLLADGPYFFPEIRVYATNPIINDKTDSLEKDCRITLIKGLTTKPYKAADFGTAKIHMPGDKPEPEQTAAEVTKPKTDDEDPLLKEANKLLKEAEEQLEQANKIN
jgi:Sel1 repeat